MDTKRKTLRCFTTFLALCFAGILILAGCINPLAGPPTEKSATPAADTTTIGIAEGQRSLNIRLTSVHTGEWKVYDSEKSTGNVSVFFKPSESVLILSSSVSFAEGSYAITVTETGKTESDPLQIKLRYPTAAPVTEDPLATTVELSSADQTSVTFTLASVIEGEWKVYGEAQEGAPLENVGVTVEGTTLTLAAIPEGSPLPGVVYYVGVTEGDRAESPRLALTVSAYDASKTLMPVVSSRSFVKITKPTTSVAFTLTNSYIGTPTWKVYASASGQEVPDGVSVMVNGNTLTLSHTEDIPLGIYYVTATESGKTESGPLALGVTLPESITFTAGSSSVSGTTNDSQSVAATVSGNPSYSTVNGKNVLTFNTTVDGNFENGDFVSLDSRAGAYIPEDNWTMELIVKSPTNGQLLSFWGPKGRNQAGSFWIEHSTGGGYWLFRVYNASSVNKGVGISRPSSTEWHHVAYVRTGGTVICYVDGAQASSANAGNPNTTFNDTPNTYFENPDFARISNCLIGMRVNNQFHQFKISKTAITPSSDSTYYNDATDLITALNSFKTDTPQVSSTTYTKTASTEVTATFTLSSTYTGAVTWKGYEAATGDTLASGVTVNLSGSTLTLTHGSDIPAGNYYVSATEEGKAESDRLVLTVVNPGASQTDTPTVSQNSVVKIIRPTAQVSFTLTNLSSGSITWKLYTESAGGTMWEGVNASSSGSTLTLTGDDIPVGTYYVSATESGKTESGRLPLTVTLPESITFTAGSGSVSGMTNDSQSVTATVSGGSYSTVNGKNVLTFNTDTSITGGTTGVPASGDFVSLNSITGAYMPENNWTMELIVKTGGATTGKILNFWGSDGAERAGSFWLENNTSGYWLLRFYNANSVNKGIGISRPNTNEWHHVAYVRMGGTVTCYVDGAQAGSANAGNPNTTFSDTPNTYFENPAFARITNCLIGLRQNSQFHQFKISKSAITPLSDSGYYNAVTGILNALNGVKTDTPQTGSAAYTKTASTETTATFTLSNSYTNPVTWKVYAGATGDTPAPSVTADLNGSTLTLTHGSDIPAGSYYVAANETGTGKIESDRLALTVASYGVPQTATPAVSQAAAVKITKTTTSATFTLTNLTSGTITWKLYTEAAGSTEWIGVTASSSGNTLTLTGTDVPVGTYYVTATESGKTESERLTLTVTLPESITFTVDSSSVSGTTDTSQSVTATVNGSPSYSTVNGKNVLTFNSAVDSNFENGDFVSLDPIAGAYIPEDNWTMELIVKSPANGQLLSFWGPKGRNQAGSFWIEHSTGGGYWLFRVYNASNANKGVKINRPSTSAWHHVAYVRTEGTVTCYLDGVQATGSDTGNPNPNTTFNGTPNTYFENPDFAQISNCLIGMRVNNQFHQFKISKTAITPSSNSTYYTAAKDIVDTLNGTGSP
jgi:hypothetical protein